MSISSTFVRTACLVTSVVLAMAPFGCGGAEEIPAAKAVAIPVHNPSPDYKLKDVTLQNEYQFKDQIGGMSKAK